MAGYNLLVRPGKGSGSDAPKRFYADVDYEDSFAGYPPAAYCEGCGRRKASMNSGTHCYRCQERDRLQRLEATTRPRPTKESQGARMRIAYPPKKE